MADMQEERPGSKGEPKLEGEYYHQPSAMRRDELNKLQRNDEMQSEAIEVAQEAMDKFSEIAHHIKRTFDERKGATWHCIVGRNFGSFVTHETKHFIYFYLGHCAILLFKTQ
ncbi:Dynein light chain, cytoplasmic [Salinomyces thailandicus]|uniref:Dynein light chain n=1 Tax=Salinomyces thailandicus TaxID=706561 RepID=A0A4U0UCW4_9PEZI|nr:Dynein light chain, cytoplasmic [Salinomyces thailandica]